MNRIPIKKRFYELLIDYLVIMAYIFLLFIVNATIFTFIFDGFPKYTEIHVQIITTCTSVIPTIFIFSYLDFYKRGSIGKKAAGLKLLYENHQFRSSLIRNIIKFLPWQLGHIGVIRGMYQEFDILSIIIMNSGILFGLLLLFMGIFRKDQRHLGDMFAGTKVELK